MRIADGVSLCCRLIVVVVAAATMVSAQAHLPTLILSPSAEASPSGKCCDASDEAATGAAQHPGMVEPGVSPGVSPGEDPCSAPMCPEEGRCGCGCCASIAPASPLLAATAASVWFDQQPAYLLMSPSDARPDAVWLGIPFHPPIA